MTVATSPLRITLAGGGTDAPGFVAGHGGQAITAAIDKRVTVIVQNSWTRGYTLKYSEHEHAEDVRDIRHPIIRETIRFYDLPEHTEIVSLADIPSGTGLGSSGAFTVALCHAVSHYCGYRLDQTALARHAAEIELFILERGGGPQDHYASALGDIQVLTFHPAGDVTTDTLFIDQQTYCDLEARLFLFFTGISRDADHILKTQTTDGLHEIMEYGLLAQKLLENGFLDEYGLLLDDHWQAKKRRSPIMTTPQIDDCYQAGLDAGVLGGKLVGGGGAGFLLFYSRHGMALREAMAAKGLREVPFQFDSTGTMCNE